MLAINTLAIGAASFFAVVAANHGQISRAHHHNPLLERSEAHLQKRFSGQATYYAVGLGACGKWNKPSDYIVALNSAQYIGGSPGPNCFKGITICAKGKCVPATIMDECPTCDYGSLDLSEDLFKEFTSTDDGVFQMTWTYGGGGDPEPEPTTKKPDPPKTTKEPEPPKTTKEPEPEPEPTTTSKRRTSTTSKEHTTTQPETTSTPEPTTTSSTSTSTSSVPETTSTSEAKSTVTTSTVSASVSPSVGASPGSSSGSGGSNWADMAQAMLAMGRLASVAHGN